MTNTMSTDQITALRIKRNDLASVLVHECQRSEECRCYGPEDVQAWELAEEDYQDAVRDHRNAMTLAGAFYEAAGLIGIGTGDVDDCGTDSEIHYLANVVRFDDLYNVIGRYPRYGILTSQAVTGLDCPNLTAYAEVLGEDAHQARLAHEDATAALNAAESIAKAASDLAYFGEG